MFDIGWSELVLIGAVALIVIGPKELPGTLRTIGAAVAKLRRMAGEFQSQFQDAMREAELDEARKTVEGLNQSASFNPIQTIRDEIQKAVETPQPSPANPSADAAPRDAGLDIPEPPPLPDLTPEQMQAAFEPSPQPTPEASSLPAAEAAQHPSGPSSPAASPEAEGPGAPRTITPGEPPPMSKPVRPAPDPESVG